MINRILYATDLGLYGPYLLEHVMALASAHKARVQAVHAVEPIGIFAESILSAYMSPPEAQQLRHQGMGEVMCKIRDHVRMAFEDEFLESQFDRSLLEGIEVVNGKPAQVILDASHQFKCDLIVLGSSSQPGERVLGSVASRVLSEATVPVFLVPMIKLQIPRNMRLYG